MNKKQLKEKARLIKMHYDEIKKQRDILILYYNHVNTFCTTAKKETDIKVRDELLGSNLNLMSEYVLEYLDNTAQQIALDSETTKEFLIGWGKCIKKVNPELFKKLEGLRKPKEKEVNNIYG